MTEMKPLRRLGIFGGSFDPVHYGHLLLAETCREQCQLDQVWLLPAASAPHKVQKQTAGAKHRVAMLQLAVGGHKAMQVSTVEIDRGGVSYTFETLTTIREQYPDTELFFLMGADSLEDLPHWRQPQTICELAVPVVVRRAGSAEPDFSHSLTWWTPRASRHSARRRSRCQSSSCQARISEVAFSGARASASARRARWKNTSRRIGSTSNAESRCPTNIQQVLHRRGEYHRVDRWIRAQRLGDLFQLLDGIQGEVHKEPFSACKFTGPAPSSAQPFVSHVVAQFFSDPKRLFQ